MPQVLRSSSGCAFLALLLGSCWAVSSAWAGPHWDKPVSAKRQIEPRYPGWAYTHGVSKGYAKFAFYVDEYGETSEFLPIEYTYEAFAEELLSALKSWEFNPAEKDGVPVKSVCHAYWEFLPDRPIETNALFDTAKRMDEKGGRGNRGFRYREEEELDRRLQMLSFPGLVLTRGSDEHLEEETVVRAEIRFFVLPDGAVALPEVVDCSLPELNGRVERAFKQAAFELPTSGGEAALALLNRTYDIPVVWADEEPMRGL